jgi:predicted ATPase
MPRSADDRSTAAQVNQPRAAFDEQVRDALLHLHDLARLQKSPLTRLLGTASPGDSSRAGKRLQQMLVNLIAELRPGKDVPASSHAWRTHAILTLRYVEALDVSEVIEKLAIGALLAEPQEHGETKPGSPRRTTEEAPSADRRVPELPARLTPATIPIPLSSLLGREREVAEVRRLLERYRLVTLTGPGGIGKTRLALEMASELTNTFADGVFFIPLASLNDDSLVVPTIARSLGLLEVPNRSPLDVLTGALRGKQVLLVLDNFEALVEAGPSIADLLAGCPQLSMLVTSRVVLSLMPERVYGVGPLAIPGRRAAIDLDQVREYAAVRLFVERAQAARADFALTAENVGAVGEISARLDGLPLAIELAAARVRLLSPEAMLKRLDRLLPLLSSNERDRPARHQTLRDTIAWSYDLLGKEEKALFRHLAVFVGGFTIEAALALCSASEERVEHQVTEDGPPRPGEPEGEWGTGGPLDRLESLVAKSLLRREDEAEEPRLGMLETIREFGLEQLERHGELEAAGSRHARHFLSVAEEAEPRLEQSHSAVVLDRLDRENDNFRAAIGFLRGAGAAEAGLRLAAALQFYWVRTRRFAEGRELTVGLLSVEGPVTPAIRARALNELGFLAELQFDWAAARSFAAEALAIGRARGDRQAVADALTNLAKISVLAGEYGAAKLVVDEGLQLNYALGNQQGVAAGLINLGRIAQSEGDFAAARRFIGEALAIWRAFGDEVGTESALGRLALVSLEEGRHVEARPPLAESLTICVAVGEKWGIGDRLEGFGWLAAAAGQPERALQLAGAASALSQAWGVVGGPERQAAVDRWLSAARQALDPDFAARAWAAGRAMTLEQAVACALEDGESHL